MFQVTGIDFLHLTESEAKKLPPFWNRKVSFEFVIDLANYRLHHFHTQFFLFQWVNLWLLAWHPIFSTHLSNIGSNCRLLELDERIIEESQLIHFSEARGKKTPCMLSMYSSIFPDRFSNICLPIYLINFTQYHPGPFTVLGTQPSQRRANSQNTVMTLETFSETSSWRAS